MKASELVGKRFGNIEVLRREPNNKYGNTMWLCRCDCGTEWVVVAGALKYIRNCRKCGYKKVAEHRTKHGGAYTRLYKVYKGMLGRCNNPNRKGYQNYGGRGINVCEEWQGENGYETFRKWALENGYDDKQSIERIDVNGDYCPENCKWIKKSDQAYNKRNSLIYEMDGKKQDLAQWAREYGINYYTLWSRLKRGMDIRSALTKPLGKRSVLWSQRLEQDGNATWYME